MTATGGRPESHRRCKSSHAPKPFLLKAVRDGPGAEKGSGERWSKAAVAVLILIITIIIIITITFIIIIVIIIVIIIIINIIYIYIYIYK